MHPVGSNSNMSGMTGAPATSQAQQQAAMMAAIQQQQQAAAAALGARAPSPGGAAQLPAMPAGTQLAITVHLRNQQGQMALTSVPLDPAFINQHRNFISKNIGTLQTHPLIYSEYAKWRAAQQQPAAGAARPAAAAAAPPAKRVKTEAGAAAAPRPAAVPVAPNAAMFAAMAAMRPPLPPGMMLPGMLPPGVALPGMAPGVTAAQMALAAQARLQQSIAAKRQFAPITRPANDDERQYVPHERLEALVRQVGQGMGLAAARSTEDAEGALRAVAEDFISGAVSFAVAAARRRGSEEVQPADLLLYLERTWNLQVPGFSSRDVRPYQRAAPSADHQRRLAAVRRAMAATSASQEAAPAAAPAAPAAKVAGGGTPGAPPANGVVAGAAAGRAAGGGKPDQGAGGAAADAGAGGGGAAAAGTEQAGNGGAEGGPS